jgi:hypothetical protein
MTSKNTKNTSNPKVTQNKKNLFRLRYVFIETFNIKKLLISNSSHHMKPFDTKINYLVVGSLPTTTFSLYAGISRVSLSSHKKD